MLSKLLVVLQKRYGPVVPVEMFFGSSGASGFDFRSEWSQGFQWICYSVGVALGLPAQSECARGNVASGPSGAVL